MLAEELHYTRAAARLNIATPTLTVQIQEIERWLGAQLLDRSRRGTSLTQAGEIFLAEARAVLARFDHAESVERRAAVGQIGRLEVGYVGSAAYAGVLQRQIRQFRGRHPDVDVHTRELPMDDLPGLVLSRSIDMGFVRLPMVLSDGLETRVLLHDIFCVAVHAEHALASHPDDLMPLQLAHEPFVVPEQMAGTYEIARRGGFTPNVVARPGSLAAVLTAVSLGTGIAIVPDSVCNVLRIPDVCYRYIRKPPILSQIAAIFVSEPSTIGAMFMAGLDCCE